ncbi:MAG: class I SAM-dependent methyltransferase [Chloroflexi bacterium]|nr:class I SAM-dependent methyltransferase [Chloroflexota bacterium]
MTPTSNLTQVRWLIGQGWQKVAAEYAKDRVGIFGQFAKRLLSILHPLPGNKLLDVGAGTGAIALQAVEWIGSDGWAIGNDIAANMASLAAQSAETQGLTNTTFCQMDAEQLGFPNASFDIVTCGFSLFQFPDMERALVEMQRVLKPGGKLALSNWAPGYFSPVASLQRDLFRQFGLRPLLPNPITFKPVKLKALLHKVGFTNVKLYEETEEICFESPKQVWAFNLDMGPFPVMLQEQLSIEQQKELTQQVSTVLKDLMTEQGIKCTFHPLYSLAEKRAGY